jgi:hypothetical protein
MYNQMFGNKTLGEKVLTAIIMWMIWAVFITVPCGIAWIISLFGVAVNYLIPAGIGAFIYLFGVMIALLKLKQFKRVSENMEKEFDKF